MMTHLVVLFASALSSAAQTQMPLTTIVSGANSGIDAPRTVVVRTAAEWATLWAEHAGKGKPPAVDFSGAMVVGVFVGTKPSGGYGVEITRIDKRDDGAVVAYRERQPGPDDIVSMALTSPFHVVRTESVSGQVTFQRAR